MLSFDRQGAAASSHGCPFSTRCPYVIKGTCETQAPPMRRFANGHIIACHLTPEQLSAMKPLGAAPERAAATSSLRPAPTPAPGPLPSPQMAPARVAAPAPVAPAAIAPATAPSRAPAVVAKVAEPQPVVNRAAAQPVVAAAAPAVSIAAPAEPQRTAPMAPAGVAVVETLVPTHPIQPALGAPVRLSATASLAGHQTTPVSGFSATSAKARALPQAANSVIASASDAAPLPRPKGLPPTAALARQQMTAFSAQALAALPAVPVGPPALPSQMAAPAPVLGAPSARLKRLPATAALARQQATSFSAEAVATKR